MADLGIDVTDVRILRTDLTPKVSKQTTFDRMSAERLAQAAAIRAGGQQAAQSLKAIADRQAVEVVAAANKDSEVLRGEGDAQRSRHLCQGLWSGPGVLRVLPLAAIVPDGARGFSGTTMVLAPDTDFFKYFKADTLNGTLPVPAAPNGIAAAAVRPDLTCPSRPTCCRRSMSCRPPGG